MRCGVLGPLEVHDDGGEVLVVPGAKERRLLAMLIAAHPSAVSVDRLVDQLWDGHPPPTARKSLQGRVVRLRSTLEPGRPHGSPGRFITRREDGYVLAATQAELDVLEFSDLCSRGRAMLSAGDPVSSKSALTQALALWRGEPYADWPDASFAEMERRRLEGIRGNAVCALLEAELALGRHREAVPELERMVLEQPLREDFWSMLAVALYRSGRQGDALATVRRARGVLVEELGVSPGPTLRSTEQALLEQDPALDPPFVPAPDVKEHAPAPDLDHRVTGCPYKGLAAYETDDAPMFRGRADLVERLVALLVDGSLLVVSGSSGAGKSSVVRAGLLPALSSGALVGSEDWPQLVITAGPHAVDALAELSGEEAPRMPVVLVVDQLEQQWSSETDPGERTAFLDSVLGLVAEGRVARCVLVIRADYIGLLAEHRGMAGRMVRCLELVPPLTEPQLREVLEWPTAAAGLIVEPDLVDTVVREVLGRNGGLPLMSVAMVGTWARHHDDTLTLAGYLAAGGVAGAIATAAEGVLATFDPGAQEVARQVLVRLAEHDELGGLRRRRMPLAELDLDGPSGAARRTVVEALVAHRLLTMDSAYLEVAHEALLTAWPRLTRWLTDDAVGRAVRRHLAPAAQEWAQHGRPTDELYRGTRLDAAVEWASAADAVVTAVEREFLDSGIALARSELTAARARADQEAASRSRTRRLAVGLSAALVLTLVAAGFAVRFQQAAEDRATEARTAGKVADANRLAALSTSARSLDLSLLLAAAAMETARTPNTEDGLFDALLTHRRATGVFSLGEAVFETAIGADARTLFVTRLTAERVSSWQVGSPEAPRTIAEGWPSSLAVAPGGDVVAMTGLETPLVGPPVTARSSAGELVGKVGVRDLGGGEPQSLAFTPDGRLLAVVIKQRIEDKTPWRSFVTELHLDGRAHGPMRLVARSPGGGNEFLESAFAKDGSGVVAWSADGRAATYLDIATGRRTPLELARRDATSQWFVVTPAGVLQTWSDGAVTRYETNGRLAQVLEAHAERVRDALVVPGGSMAVTVGDGGAVELWDISAKSGAWSRRESLPGHSGNVVQAEVAGDGTTLFTVSQDGMLITWDLTGTQGFGGTYGGPGDRWISNRIQVVDPGRVVVAPARTPFGSRASAGNVAALFLDPKSGRELDRVKVSPGMGLFQWGSSVAVSPDRRLVAVTHGFGTAIVDTRTREIVHRVVLPGDDPSPDWPAVGVWCSAWTPDGSRLLLCADGEEKGPLVLIDTETWRPVGKVDLPGVGQVLEWSPDHSVLAAGLWPEGAVSFLDRDLNIMRTAPVGDEPVDLAWSPDGSRLAVGGSEGYVSVLDKATGRLVHRPAKLFSSFVGDVEWLPDGGTVVASGDDDVAAMYDVDRDIVRVGSMPATDTLVNGYAYLMPSPTDEVVVLDGQHPGHRYPLDPSQWLARACQIAGRDLSPAEWHRYVPTEPYDPPCAGAAPGN
ncbi:MAG: nSTAND1 domain-containing NTPase [Nocardioides sp.]